MHKDHVKRAIRTLEQQGERISVRKVHALTGGHYPQVAALVREITHTEEEDEPSPLPTVSPSQTAASAVEQADERLRQASTSLVDAEERLIDVVQRATAELAGLGTITLGSLETIQREAQRG